ncbi:MAG: deoxyhypusine synthase family protein [Candidatus Yanofskybacteria bacterium]|nr:deoxyhypusine synthase family protein [Candidatus Yanofskybacteria bacterium]
MKQEIKELKLLDLRRSKTAADIVEGMSRCSFGARMLGEAAITIKEWIEDKEKTVVVFDGNKGTSLSSLLAQMAKKKWFSAVKTPNEFARSPLADKAIVIGVFPDRISEAVFNRAKEAIYINPFGVVKPGQIKDGYFPNAVFTDPRFALPAINCFLEEKLEGRGKTVTEFLAEIKGYGGLSSDVEDGAQTLLKMADDPECFTFLTLSGAMTIAKMGLVVCDMIDDEMVQAVSSTGALMAHGLVESVGLKHFKYDPKEDDVSLAKKRLNRVTDTLEPETNLNHIEEVIGNILKKHKKGPMSPAIFHKMIGKHLSEKYPKSRGILKSAYKKRVTVFVPAFHDSEIGNDAYIYNKKRELKGLPPIVFNQEIDTKTLIDLAVNSKKMGIFTLGGGVPRNYVQNVAPLIEIMNERLPRLKLPTKKFNYGCRIAPDQMYYGHLSGCTYSEGMSWRKMDVNGKFTEIRADATQVWPFMVKFVMENRGRNLPA